MPEFFWEADSEILNLCAGVINYCKPPFSAGDQSGTYLKDKCTLAR
jgi:hypothetical protein